MNVQAIVDLERGEPDATFTAILRIASSLSVPPALLFQNLGSALAVGQLPYPLTAVATSDGLLLRFRYDQYDAEYLLSGAHRQEYDQVIATLRSGLIANKRSAAVASAFLTAVKKWPESNPSDLWTFLINRAYCDRTIHPSSNARLNLEQSWKRTSGWALEQVMVEHYGRHLRRHGLEIQKATKASAAKWLDPIGDPTVIPDKVDILLLDKRGASTKPWGVVHVKASLAERRTDDVPMSRALIAAGLMSIFWTLDVKSMPARNPVNRGEFGAEVSGKASDKRRDIEVHRHFSACFSYNSNHHRNVTGNARSSADLGMRLRDSGR